MKATYESDAYKCIMELTKGRSRRRALHHVERAIQYMTAIKQTCPNYHHLLLLVRDTLISLIDEHKWPGTDRYIREWIICCIHTEFKAHKKAWIKPLKIADKKQVMAGHGFFKR
jgi:hypothetical protein